MVVLPACFCEMGKRFSLEHHEVSLSWACRALHIFFPGGEFALHLTDMDQSSMGPQLCGERSDPQMSLRLEASDLRSHQTVKERMWGRGLEGSSFITVSKKTCSHLFLCL